MTQADKVSEVPAGTWKIDPSRSSVTFEVRHLGLQVVRGVFSVVGGIIVTQEDPKLSNVEAVVDVASVDSGMTARDNAIRSADLLNTAEHPVASYRSRAVRRADQKLLVDGTLELFATPRPLTFMVRVRDIGSDTLTLSAEAELGRRAFGVRFRGKPAFFDRAIADRVKLSMQITAAATQLANPTA